MHFPLKKVLPLILSVTAVFFFSTPAFADSVYHGNVYLGSVTEFNPQLAGAARNGTYEIGMIGPDHMPLYNEFSLGPPTGTGSWVSSSENDGLMTGINGSAAFAFQEGFYIYNGEGDDFRTWGDRFCWGGAVDGHCSELAHIEVSADMETWYYNSAELYDINPDPSQGNGDYVYHNVHGLHGNTPNWANYTKDMQAQQEIDGIWTDIEGVVVPHDFGPNTPWLGGDTFDLSDYLSKEDDSPWADDAEMRYIRMVDDDSILDGQSYSPPWKTGAIMQAAMGVNVMQVDPVPIPGAVWLLVSGLLLMIGIKKKPNNFNCSVLN